MDDFLNKDKGDKLKEVLLKISSSGVVLSSEMISKTLFELEDIYWQSESTIPYRHMYSEIFAIITQIDRSIDLDNDILSQNLLILCKKYMPNINKDSNGNCVDISKSLMKLYDHVNLDIARLNYSKSVNHSMHEQLIEENENKLREALQDSVVDIKKENAKKLSTTTTNFENFVKNKIRDVENKADKMRSEYISILGIFASIVLAFTGGLTFSTSVLSNIHKASIYRMVIITALIGMVLIFVLWLLMDFIKSVHGQNKRKYSYIIVPEVVLIIIIVGTLLVYRLDYFKFETPNSIYESNTESEY